MNKSKKTRKTGAASVLTPEEQGLLDGLLRDLSRVDPSRLAEEARGPQFAEALVARLP